MRQLIYFRSILFSILCAVGILIVSCDKDMHVSLGNANENLGVNILDSMTIQASTFQLNNIPSSATGTILVGKAEIPETGTVSSSSYFRLALTSFLDDIPDDAAFDSLTLVVRPNASRYYYGDTTQSQKIVVHRVTQDIVPTPVSSGLLGDKNPIYITDASVYTSQSFEYDDTPLGSLTFLPRMRGVDTLSIRLEDNLGQEIYDLIQAKDLKVLSNENFVNYLKGLVIVPDNQNTAIVGLNDTVNFNINYSYMGADGFKKTGKKTIVTGAKGYQFNSLSYDRTQTVFESLSGTNREIKSTQTGGKVFLQGGTGVVAKLTIPSLNLFMQQPDIAINKAELIIETDGFNYGPTPAPPALILFIAGYDNVPYSYLMNPFSTSLQQAAYVPGDGFAKKGQYVFNLIDYIKTVNAAERRESSLFLSVASTSLFATANTAVIATENNKPKIKLNIVYTKFK